MTSSLCREVIVAVLMIDGSTPACMPTAVWTFVCGKAEGGEGEPHCHGQYGRDTFDKHPVASSNSCDLNLVTTLVHPQPLNLDTTE